MSTSIESSCMTRNCPFSDQEHVICYDMCKVSAYRSMLKGPLVTT